MGADDDHTPGVMDPVAVDDDDTRVMDDPVTVNNDHAPRVVHTVAVNDHNDAIDRTSMQSAGTGSGSLSFGGRHKHGPENKC
jgi:hypothetical protein